MASNQPKNPGYWYEQYECALCGGGGLIADVHCAHDAKCCECFGAECALCAGTGMIPIPFSDVGVEDDCT